MWIPVTLLAATFQVLRTARQHRLRSWVDPRAADGRTLSVNEAGFVRYAYGFPLASIACVATFTLVGRDLPAIPWRFWPIIAVAGVAQILGTLALLRSFDLRDFAIGTVYAKTEVLIVAFVSAVALGEPLQPGGWIAAVVCMIGVAWLAAPDRLREAIRGAADPAAGMGVLAALGFAIAAAGIRAASTTLEPVVDGVRASDGDAAPWERAVLTLTVMLAIQTIVNGAQIARSSGDALDRVIRAWRPAMTVGILSVGGSAGWALAVTLTNAAKVRTLGQVELLLAFVVSAVWLRERHTRSEYAASALVLAGIVGVVVLG